MPPFVNAAFNMPVEASNTCGLREAQEFCLQTGVTGARKSCDICDANDPNRMHPPSYLTDFNDKSRLTWWQSETMLQGAQNPNVINITLTLGKSFDITYVRLKFYSSRPESFAIYKRTNENSTWVPYQFYSASCEDTYRKQNRGIITRGDETQAICSDEYSDISPLTGGSVAFSTLEGRPSAYDFENSPVLQEWVTATDIKIVLTRMNTFGDEVFGDPQVLKSYFYAISDFAVGGRCKCNGHASECTQSTGNGMEMKLVCNCEHHTKGQNCEVCDDFYNSQPWQRATPVDAHECQPCNCNGLSNRCYFDEDMWRRTGDGGHCIECRDFTSGAHCERCQDYYFRRSENERCQPCNCNPTGSETEQCDMSGRCRCKPGVTGEKCDRCMPNFFEFGPAGCRQCACVLAGSRDNTPFCLPDTGTCTCKEFVEGQNCDVCKPGYFNLMEDNPYGCIACYCHGHSSICTSAPGFTSRVIHSSFDSGRQRWLGGYKDRADEVETNYNAIGGSLGISSPSQEAVYFIAPDRYLGNQQYSYNQFLEFKMSLGEDGAQPSLYDVVIEGAGLQIYTPIYSQANPVPRTIEQVYRFRLNEHQEYQWNPRLTALEFHRLLSNITSIKIRGTYTPGGVSYIDEVKLHSARQGGSDTRVSHIEQCTCPEGYIGQFCESCSPGYHRDPPNGGALDRCVPCNCNGHSESCNPNSGQCICEHNTAGVNCERCAPGFYGYALAGTPDDCKPCPCPGNGECVELLNGDVLCINCGEGVTGNRCDECIDGYFGDPQGRNGPPRPCEKCRCNDNIDPNAVGNCDRSTGECLKCIYNTGGYSCDKCKDGYYGDALELPKGGCKACDCHPHGSVTRPGQEGIPCDQRTGQCSCLPNVIGRKCDQCFEAHWNINSGNGCEPCRCDPLGSFNRSCDIYAGQCPCKQGVGSRTCGSCLPLHFGFDDSGCDPCECDPEGSTDRECDVRTGQCPCHTSIEGRKCDRCEENKFNITAGCIDCPPCYTLVQKRVNIHRRKLNDLREIINNIGNNPGDIDDTDFRRRLLQVQDSVNDLVRDARQIVGDGGPIGDQLEALQEAIRMLMMECGKISSDIADARITAEESDYDVSGAERAIEDAERALRDAENYIENEGYSALQQAREAQQRFGQQSDRMTEIAKQARELAERQEEEATQIEQTAKDALNMSREALNTARESFAKPAETARELETLRREVTDGDRLHEQTKAMAERALQQAKDAYDDSLGILTESRSITVPSVDTTSLKDEAQLIKDDATRIKEEAETLLNQQRQLMADVDQEQIEAEEQLESGIRQQQIADELLADADVAREIARDAIAKAEKTLKDANETLKTLNGFDERVQQSQQGAADAEKKIPDIENQIREAEVKTRDARYSLAGAVEDANMARDIAQEAQATAEMASNNADEIREEAETTKDRAEELNRKATQLAADVDSAEQKLEEQEQQAAEDERLAEQALSKADQAKTSADDSSSKVSGALSTVNDILRQLSGLAEIDTGKLDELEENLNKAEQRLIDANLEERYNALFAARQQQNQWVRDYTNELIKLREDVANIKKINETIPRTCFRNVELEPTDPTS